MPFLFDISSCSIFSKLILNVYNFGMCKFLRIFHHIIHKVYQSVLTTTKKYICIQIYFTPKIIWDKDDHINGKVNLHDFPKQLFKMM